MKNLFTKIKKADKKPTTLESKVKRGYRFYCGVIVAMTFLFANALPAFAASDPLQVVNNLSDFIFGDVYKRQGQHRIQTIRLLVL